MGEKPWQNIPEGWPDKAVVPVELLKRK
jgi:hypothetical protein